MRKETAIALVPLAVSLLLGTSLMGQGLHLKGQLWGSVTAGNDPAPGHSDVEEVVGYIPILSLARQPGPLSVIDLEYAYYLNAVLDGPFGNGEAGVDRYSRLYRLWGRIATERFELRLGLQKIAFGPGRVLRPLMWFDTLDLRDPTGQTEGVGALRLKWYPWPKLALWGWVIRPDYQNYASPGGRVGYTLGPAEFGLTYHRHKASELDFIGRQLLPFDNEEERFAMDARLDWEIGFWTEAVLARGREPALDDKTDELAQLMIGGDYTFPWGNGVYVMVEHLWSRLDYYEPPPPWY
ncbi:MAG: hypothetical protein ACETWG_01110 [Candidatus Neomarinimicrobiota bacterium]